MLNDGIEPKSFFGEFIRRMKYVDDFQDIMACSRTDLLFKSVIRNSERIYSQSTSLGFKINEIKLKMLAFHIPESEVNPAFKYVPGTNLLVKQEADLSDEDLAKLPPLLGLGFDIFTFLISSLATMLIRKKLRTARQKARFSAIAARYIWPNPSVLFKPASATL